MRRILFDTSIYIGTLRIQDYSWLRVRSAHSGTALWLSSVVLEELYAGAQGRSIELVEKLERDFKTAQRILTPNTSDWAAAGRVLARIGTKYGFDQIGKARLTNDTLIAVSSSRTGTHVLTANAKDFGRIAEFRKFEWELVQPRDLS